MSLASFAWRSASSMISSSQPASEKFGRRSARGRLIQLYNAQQARSAGLRPVEYANHNDLIAVLVEFTNDDVRQARHRPFVGAGHNADAAELGEFAEPIGLDEDALGDVDCRLCATLLYI